MPLLRRLFICSAGLALALCWIPAVAGAYTSPAGWPVPYLTPRATGLVQPVFVTGDGSGVRTYVVERRGRILTTDSSWSTSPASSVFLDITDLTTTDGERGLLGLCFASGYATNGRFYVYYTDTSGSSRIVRFLRDPSDPNKALRASATTILTVGQPYSNHNGGWIGFGPDGYLYAAFGDGGSAGDPGNRAQDLSTLLGKIIRIDVEGGATTYSIPPSNPWAGSASARDEIWSLGLRNPWRCSFDSAGRMFIGDVGQRAREEIDVEPAGVGGRNYGWRRWEGRFSYSPGTAVTPSPGGLHFPEVEIAHETAESITGGYVYEGSKHPLMSGTYVFGDYVLGRIWAARGAGSAWTTRMLAERSTNPAYRASNIAAFGTDDARNLYVCSFSNGTIYELGDAETYSDRLAGRDRYAAAVAIAKRSYPAWSGAKDVVIASGEDRAAADPLTASGLCWAYDAPLLLVSGRTVTTDVKSAIRDIEAANGRLRLHIVGGPVSIPQSRIDELVAAAKGNATVDRVLATGDRYDLAAKIADRMKTVRSADFPARALLANGADSNTFFDALALSAIARRTGSPILLCATSSAPSATRRALVNLGLSDRWSAGGPKTLSPALLDSLGVPPANRIQGTDRYDNARDVADTAIAKGWLTPAVVSVASRLPDAVAGGAAAGRAGGPLLVCGTNTLTQPPAAFMTARKASMTEVRVLGGGLSVTDEVRGDVARARE